MPTDPAPIVDRVHAFVGSPSVQTVSSGRGALAGLTVAVKDVIDVAGTVTGAGNPTFAAAREPASVHAAAVQALVDEGATVIGKTVTDELAYSLAGSNVHYGTPVNVAAPGRIPGGSSAGSAAAVAAGLVDLGLGTDTGGSIRVPASYCGLAGWRPTHGAVDDRGVVHLARSFDTVGLLARTIDPLVTAANVLLAHPGSPTPSRPAHEGASAPGPHPPVATVVRVQEWFELVDEPARVSAVAATGRWVGRDANGDDLVLGVDLAVAAEAFRVLQGREAWIEHGDWITEVRPVMGQGIAARFRAASQITDAEVGWAQTVRDEVRRVVVEATAGGRVLVGPASGGAAPRLAEPAETWPGIRARTLRLTCLAGLSGAPVVVLPIADDGGLPLGIAGLGAPGSDRELLHWAAAVDRADVTGPGTSVS